MAAIYLYEKMVSNCNSTSTFPRTDWLDGKHVVFGNVISGADVVRKMERCGSKSGKINQKVTIVACGELKG